MERGLAAFRVLSMFPANKQALVHLAWGSPRPQDPGPSSLQEPWASCAYEDSREEAPHQASHLSSNSTFPTFLEKPSPYGERSLLKGVTSFF